MHSRLLVSQRLAPSRIALVLVLSATLIVALLTGSPEPTGFEESAAVMQSVRLGLLLTLLLTPIGFFLLSAVWTVSALFITDTLRFEVNAWRLYEALAVAEAVRILGGLMLAYTDVALGFQRASDGGADLGLITLLPSAGRVMTEHLFWALAAGLGFVRFCGLTGTCQGV